MNIMETGATTPMTGPDFATFFDANRSRLVRALAVTIGDAGAAAESVDEAMARAWDRWDTVRGLDAPAGWVYRVALNHGRSRWRRQRHERLQPFRGDASTVDLATTDPTPLGDELQRAVLALALPQREVVVLRLLLDFDTAATARILDVAEGTVRSRLARAVATLRNDPEVSQ